MVKIIVEGEDDKKFIISLINHLIQNNDIDKINRSPLILSMGGKSKLLDYREPKYIKNMIPQVKSGKLKKVLFVFDCDFKEDDHRCGGMDKSKQCFDDLIEKLGWNISIDCYIFNRNLDYFLMETINNQQCYKHFDGLSSCLELEKCKANRKPIANLYRDLYPYPMFDFKGDRFTPLKNKLIELFKT